MPARKKGGVKKATAKKGGAKKAQPKKDDKPTPHAIHNDPNDDILIISNDNVEFRASSYHLIRVSSLFEGMLTTPRPDRKREKLDIEPIHLDYEANVIAYFLDMTKSHQPAPPETDPDTALSLLALAEFALSDSLIAASRQSIINSMTKDPLELLVIASNRNDDDMARAALRLIHDKQTQLVKNPSAKDFSDYLK